MARAKPSLFPRSVRTVIVAELVGAPLGIGKELDLAKNVFDMATVPLLDDLPGADDDHGAGHRIRRSRDATLARRQPPSRLRERYPTFTASSAAGVLPPKLSVERVRKSFREANGADVPSIADLSFTV